MLSTRELASLAKALGSVVREHVAKAVGDLSAKLAELEQKVASIPAGKDGADGINGKDGLDGKDAAPGVDGKDGSNGINGKDGAPGASGRDGLDGKDGAPGINGKSVTADELLPTIRQWFDALPRADGKDGRDGADGKSITVEDIRQLFESEQAKWALDFERRATDLINRCIDRIEKPKDGLPGRDAFQLEDVEVTLGTDNRTLTMAFVREGARVERSIVLHHPIYRGVYKAGDKYQRGDTVSFGGSTFTAMRDTSSKPETDDSWKLACKRGRDGKDAPTAGNIR